MAPGTRMHGRPEQLQRSRMQKQAEAMIGRWSTWDPEWHGGPMRPMGPQVLQMVRIPRRPMGPTGAEGKEAHDGADGWYHGADGRRPMHGARWHYMQMVVEPIQVQMAGS